MSQGSNPTIRKKLRHVTTGDIYLIRFEFDGNEYVAFVEEYPSSSREFDSRDTHIMHGGRLCFAERTADFERAFAFALTWVDYYSELIRTGNTQQRNKRVHVNE